MAQRLIDANDFYKKLQNRTYESWSDYWGVTDILNDMPTIAQLKHGEWEVGCAGKIRICSNCKESFDDTCNFIERDWYYCPNCGAKMDGER